MFGCIVNFGRMDGDVLGGDIKERGGGMFDAIGGFEGVLGWGGGLEGVLIFF